MKAIIFTKNNARVTVDDDLIERIKSWPNVAIEPDHNELLTAPPEYWVKTLSGKVRVMNDLERVERDKSIAMYGVDNEIKEIKDFVLCDDFIPEEKIAITSDQLAEAIASYKAPSKPLPVLEKVEEKKSYLKPILIAAGATIAAAIYFMVKHHG